MRFFECFVRNVKGAVCCVCAASFVSLAMAASYTDNTYQKLSDEYLALAEAADDAGEYGKSYEYAQKARENADLSKEFVANMTARDDSSAALSRANSMLARAKRTGLDESNSEAYNAAQSKMQEAQAAFDEGKYDDALKLANDTIALLKEAGVSETPPLPEYYIVDTWANLRDCLWNIAGRPYVYNDPTRWKKLYNENKHILRQPSNPDLIHPTMKLHIPKLGDEYREGVYDPKEEYDTIGQ